MHPMFTEGFNLMLTGMGVVFAFLILLVWMISLMSKLVVRFAPEEVPAVAPAARPPASSTAASPAAGTVPLDVIREAVRQHRAAGN